MTPRDSQRKKVYDAELAAFPGHHGTGMTVEDMQALVDKWCSSKGLQARYPRAARPPRVTDGRGRRRGGCYAGELRMPRFCRTQTYLLHELAHHLTFRTGASHGWEFCECYLYLVRVFRGRWAEEALKREYQARKVKCRKPRRSNMSPEQRRAAGERLRALNAARAA